MLCHVVSLKVAGCQAVNPRHHTWTVFVHLFKPALYQSQVASSHFALPPPIAPNAEAPGGVPIVPLTAFVCVVSKSMSNSSCSSSMRCPTLLLLSARSMLVLAEPLESVLVGAADRAASSRVRCSSCVSMLMLACLGGLLIMGGLMSPLAVTPAG